MEVSRSPNGSSAARLNAAYNCLDRHLTDRAAQQGRAHLGGRAGRFARADLPDARRAKSGACANALKSLGVKEGDRVAIYMPLVPEAMIAMLACARIGAIHSVIFGGFSAEALVDRINDAEAKVCITADAGWRRGQQIPLKPNVDEALKRCPSVEKCVVVRRTGAKVEMRKGRDVWWDELVAPQSSDLRAGAARLRASALHALHLRHHRQAQGRRAYHRRLPGAHADDDEVGIRSQGGGHLLVHRRYRMGHRPQLHRLRAAGGRARRW